MEDQNQPLEEDVDKLFPELVLLKNVVLKNLGEANKAMKEIEEMLKKRG